MRLAAAALVTTAAVFGQGNPKKLTERTFAIVHAESAESQRELAMIVKAEFGIADAVLYTVNRSLTIRATAAQIAGAEWLLGELDRPAATPDRRPFASAAYPVEYGEAVRVFYTGGARSAGEMIELPAMPPASTGIQRSGKLTLDAAGTLQGEIKEVRLGDQARWQREVLHGSSQKAEWVKPIESLLAHSFANFRIARATVTNLEQNDLPFGYSYELVAENYGKTTGNMMLVRPRVLGTKSSGVLDTKEPRNYPVDFEGPSTDTDSFEITLPPGFVVDDLPPAVNADYLFASYHSKTEVNGNILHYSRTMEIKQLAVPVAKMADLKRFYQIINGDERNTAVLKLGAAK